MGTSQSAVARIETGEENFTADTVERVVNELDGRFHVSIAPKEMNLPWLPHAWWEMSSSGISAKEPFTYRGLMAVDNGAGTIFVMAGWTGETEPMLASSSSTPGSLIGS